MISFPIVIAAPTAKEMKALSKVLKKFECKDLVCGVGPGHTALTITRFLSEHGPHLVILAGIGGAFHKSGLNIGEVCVATSETYGDLGRCTAHGIEPIEIEGEDINTFFDLSSCLKKYFPNLFFESIGITCGPMVTVSCTSGTPERAGEIRERTGALCENMEGAAAAHATHFFDAPFMEIRGISNMAGEAERSRWDIAGALSELSQGVEKVLYYLLNKG